MGDTFTTVAGLNSAGTAAYEQYAYFALRPELYFDACASIKPTRQSHRGSTVTFNIYNDLAPAVTPLTETADVNAVAVTDNVVTLTLNEYGNAALTSAAVRGWSYLVVDQDVANVVGFNAGISFDSLARNPLVAGSNVYFGNGGAGPRNTLVAANLLRANDVRRRVANLASDNVQRVVNGLYKGFFAPEVEVDLREETGAASWRDPHTYSQPEQIWNGETGSFEGVSWIVTPRLTAANLETAQGGAGGFVNGGAVGGGTGNFDVFPVIILGNQALAKTWSTLVSAPMPQVVLGTITDKLRRFVPVGWYWNGGYGRFREQALRRIEVTTTMVK
jgi:N4-gp56 family major capsid protein